MKVLKILVCMIATILISCGNQGNGSDSNVIRVATPGKHPFFSYPMLKENWKATILMFGKKLEED